MNEIVTLKRKVVSLGKLGFWMTAVTILISSAFGHGLPEGLFFFC